MRIAALLLLASLAGCSLVFPLDDLSSGCGDGCVCTRDDHCGPGERCASGVCTSTCGDGELAAEEDCDHGSGNGPAAACTEGCVAARCGDGLLLSDTAAASSGLPPEACDDGDTSAGDGCAPTCEVEPGWTCDAGGCEPTCGDGVVLGGEACDDGGDDDGDGCASTCEVEYGWACGAATPSVCTPICGNGVLHGGEACDDANQGDGDGCSAACAVEDGWTCMGSPSSCAGVCGDGLVVGAEGCDDMNASTGDGCGSCQAVVSLDVGGFAACALLTSGRVKCWGGNASGQLGLGDTAARGDAAGELGPALPELDLGTQSGAPARAAELALGLDFACARLESGRVKCWGGNGFGQLGLGDTEPRGGAPGQMGDALPFVDLGVDGGGAPNLASALAAGGHTACALLEDGSLRCWGRNDLGQLGLGDTEDRGDEPGEMGGSLPAPSLPGEVVEIALGYVHACARGAAGEVWCWGANDAGQLGIGSTSAIGDGPGELGGALLPAGVPAGFAAAGLALGNAHTCARSAGGDVRCWGDGSLGQLGRGDTLTYGDQPGELVSLPPVSLGSAGLGPFSAASLSAGGASTCAWTATGLARCWGSNNAAGSCPAGSGTLGAGAVLALSDQPAETGNGLPLLDLGAGASIASLRLGPCSGCALLTDGRLKCWGKNDVGQLALGDAATRGDGPGEMGDALPASLLP